MQFQVTKGHDAYATFTTVVDAADETEANRIAAAWDFKGTWNERGVEVFDRYEIFPDRTERYAEEESVDTTEDLSITLSAAERNIVIAALRLWQATTVIPSEIAEIAADHDLLRFRFLSDEEIDDLIEEKINV